MSESLAETLVHALRMRIAFPVPVVMEIQHGSHTYPILMLRCASEYGGHRLNGEPLWQLIPEETPAGHLVLRAWHRNISPLGDPMDGWHAHCIMHQPTRQGVAAMLGNIAAHDVQAFAKIRDNRKKALRQYTLSAAD